jgi:hypothetical protein
MSTLKFKFLTGDVNWQEYGGKFVSKRLNNGDWDYWLVLTVTNMWDATGEDDQDKYHVQIEAVSPMAAGKENVDKAISSWGMSDEDIAKYEKNPLFHVEALSEYGIFAMLWQASGNNINALLKDARKEADLITMLFGFYMDRSENGIGQDGWSLISGQDIRDYFKSL